MAAQPIGVVTLRTDTTFQVIPRAEVRQVEVIDNATVKWWLLDGGDWYAWQFFDEEGDQAQSIALQFFDDIAAQINSEDVRWQRTSAKDGEGEVWTRNGVRVHVEASA